MSLITTTNNLETIVNNDKYDVYQKSKALTFNKSYFNLKNTHTFYIIFQRIYNLFPKFIFCVVLFSFINGNKGEDEEEDKYIEVSRGERLNIKHIKDYLDIENHIDSNDFDKVKHITDSEFREACEFSSNKCRFFAKVFLYIETFTKLTYISLAIILSIYEFYNFSSQDIIICIAVLLPVILMQIFCDWGKLLEKYSRLYHDFNKLKNSHSKERIDNYDALVTHYRSTFVYADMLSNN
jgi:hypothetical protein